MLCACTMLEQQAWAVRQHCHLSRHPKRTLVSAAASSGLLTSAAASASMAAACMRRRRSSTAAVSSSGSLILGSSPGSAGQPGFRVSGLVVSKLQSSTAHLTGCNRHLAFNSTHYPG